MNRAVWVFSPRLDLFSFVVPLLVAMVVAPAAEVSQLNPGPETFVFGLTVGLMLDHGHVYGTFVPVLLDRWRKGLLGWRVWAVPLSVLLVSAGLAFLSVKVFCTVLAYLALTHVCRQQHGWLTVLERKEAAVYQSPKKFFKRLDRIFFVLSFLAPIYFWQADLSVVMRRYFNDGDMLFLLPQGYWPVIRALHHTVFTVYAVSLIVRFFQGRLALGKHIFLISNWLWFYGGLVLSPYPVFFWVTLMVCHGVSYHIHVNSYWRTSFGGHLPTWFARPSLFHVAGYLLFIYLMGTVFLGALSRTELPRAAYLAVANFFLISHYVFDGFIWRRSYRAVT